MSELSDLIAFVLATLPLVAFIVLVAETVRTGTSAAGDQPPVDLLYRAYGA